MGAEDIPWPSRWQIMCTGTSHTSIMCLKLSASVSVSVIYRDEIEIDREVNVSVTRNVLPQAQRISRRMPSPLPSPAPSAVGKQLKLSLKVLALSNVRNLWLKQQKHEQNLKLVQNQ